MGGNMKIRYIYHSCFFIETANSFLIFDYFKHRSDNRDFDFEKLLKDAFISPKPLYVFSSHSHQDHFNYDILTWINKKPDTYYILSSDIKIYNRLNNLYLVRPGDQLTLKDIRLNIFGSTDLGVSFLVNIEGLNIFHAGDLNWWKWPDDTPDEEKLMEDAFKRIVSDVANHGADIDLAFFSVDRRLEYNYLCGGQYFIEELKPKLFVPMHFWDDYKVISDFQKATAGHSTKVIEISHPNQTLYANI
jgi:L-ascorbate metabolism protein UlaG (beta-lactamase superfamily)